MSNINLDRQKLNNLIDIVKTADRVDVKHAQKQIEHLMHLSYPSIHSFNKKAFDVFINHLGTFDQIKDVDHQAYFIYSLKWAVWLIAEDYYSQLAKFIYDNIQHPSGKVRQAIIVVADIFLLNTTYDISPTKKEYLSKDRLMSFGYLVLAIEDLINFYHKPLFNKYKYVSSLPAGVYKSLQMLLNEVFLKSPYYQKNYQKFLQQIKYTSLPPTNIPTC